MGKDNFTTSETSPHRVAWIGFWTAISAAIVTGVFVITAAIIQSSKPAPPTTPVAITPPHDPPTTPVVVRHDEPNVSESPRVSPIPPTSPPKTVIPEKIAVTGPALQYTDLPPTAVAASAFVKMPDTQDEYVHITFASIDPATHATSVAKLPSELSKRWLVEKDLTVLLTFQDGQSHPYGNVEPIFIPSDTCIRSLKKIAAPATLNKPSLQIVNIPRSSKPMVFIRVNVSGRGSLVSIPVHWNIPSGTTEVLELPPGIPSNQLGIGDVRLVVGKNDNGEFTVYANNAPIPVSSTRVSTFDADTVRPILELKH